MEITLYIPCYNAEKYIKHTLDAVLGQTLMPSEILVIDDGSTDQSVNILKQYPVKLIKHDTNRGLAAARNTALQHAQFEYLASIDADVAPDKNWLYYLLDALKTDDVVGAGGRLIEKFQQTPADKWRALHMCQDLGNQARVISWPEKQYLAGFGSIFKKKALESVGGYNNIYRTNYEDADMGYRLLKAGYSIAYEPKAVAYHMRQDSAYSLIRTAWRWDYWPQHYKGGYNNIIKKLIQNMIWEIELLQEHTRPGYRQLIYVDLLYIILYIYWDLKYFFSLSGGK